ncbi:MAG TPA: tetratricopeptide repeat protein [Planctomycetaceae bacterium]|nr:tetratricopeptide repeat protein [Planctomycetaceae bacterium]
MGLRTVGSVVVAFGVVTAGGFFAGRTVLADDAEAITPVRRYALIIAVRTYSKTELRNLQFTESDAERLSDALVSAGYRKEDIRVLSHKAGADDADLAPTARNIREQLRLTLSDRRPDESVLVAFAGHGLQFKGSVDHYFCPTDARLADKSTLVSLADVYAELKASKAGFKLLLVDACRNDPQAEGTRARSEVDLESVTRPQVVQPPGGVAALFSCSAGEKSFEHGDLKQGVFFHFVVKGLKGEADANKDGTVTLSELSDLVQVRVPDFVKSAYSVRQMPSLIGEVRGIVPLTRVQRAGGPLERGKSLLKAFLYDDAIAVLTQAIAADPANVECYTARAEAHAGKADSDARLADLTKAVELAPNDPSILNDRGWARLAVFDRAGAAADFDRVLELLTPHDAATFTLRGDARHGLLLLDRPVERGVMEDYDEAIRRDPRHVNAWLFRGHLHAFRRRYAEALADLNEAVRLDPTRWDCFSRRSDALQEKAAVRPDAGDHDRALNDVNEALRLNPHHVGLLVARGHALRNLERKEDALASYEEALRRNPRAEYAHNGRGNVLFDSEKYAEAAVAYEEAIRIRPCNSTLVMNRGNNCRARKQFEEALADFKAAADLDPKNAYVWIAWGVLFSDQEKYEEALRATTRGIELNGDVPYFHSLRGGDLGKLKRFDEANAAFQKALDMNPRLAAAFSGRGSMYHNQKQYGRAIDEFTRAIEIEPKSWASYLGRALAHDNQGDNRKAIADYTETIRLRKDGETYVSYNLRSRCHRALGEYREAVADCSEALRMAPDDPIAHFDRGRAYSKLKEYVKAIEDYNKAISLSPERKDFYFFWRGDAYLDNGNYDWAIADLTEAIRLDPQDADNYLWRSSAYRKKGDSGRAKADYGIYKRLSGKGN